MLEVLLLELLLDAALELMLSKLLLLAAELTMELLTAFMSSVCCM